MPYANPPEGKPFTTQNQPAKRGRYKNVFGKLAKENNLSLEDVRNVYKNILTMDYSKLDELKEQYPCSFVRATVDIFKQETGGVLSGRVYKVIRDGMETEIQERVKSYDLAK